MSRHEGVSCDSCMKINFRGRRYKCLICYDYDLCGSCYDAEATTSRHLLEHPMQCILTRMEFDLYYGGESIIGDQPQSFTCPYCGTTGFSEQALLDHAMNDHAESTNEVVCPVCASLPISDPNLLTDDLASHLAQEHRIPGQEFITFLEEPTTRSHGLQRRSSTSTSRGTSTRNRRSNTHFGSSGGLASIGPPPREGADPLAELLSHLSAARCGSTPTQLQQLQMQLQLERQQIRAAAQQLERLPKRNPPPQVLPSASFSFNAESQTSSSRTLTDSRSSNSMLCRNLEPSRSDLDLEESDRKRADRLLFARELVLDALCDTVPQPLNYKPDSETCLKYLIEPEK